MKKFKKILLIGTLLFPIISMATCNCEKGCTEYEITTGGSGGTYIQIGRDLAKYVAPQACIDLKVITSKGSLDNVYKLRSPKYPKLKFAIVQNDVLQELKRLADEENNPIAKDLVDKLRVIRPLYNEEIHILTLANSNINSFGDLKGKTISVGKQKSGTAMTSMLLYKELFNQDLTKYKFQNFNDALKSLEKKEVDAIIKVAGQPVSRLSKKMNASASKFIKLLSYDERNTKHNAVTSYYATDIKADSYPWLNTDTPTLSTKAYLITFNYKVSPTKENIVNFVKALDKKINKLQRDATNSSNTPHLKWKQISTACNQPLPGGWKYYSPIEDECGKPSNQNCSDYKRSLGLCE